MIIYLKQKIKAEIELFITRSKTSSYKNYLPIFSAIALMSAADKEAT